MEQYSNDKKCQTMFIRRSFLIKNQLNNPKLRHTLENKRLSRKSKVLFKDLKIFESKKLKLLKMNPMLIHFDLFFLAYCISQKDFQYFGFDFAKTIFMEKQNAVFNVYQKNNKIVIKDLRKQNVVYSQVFDKFFSNQNKQCNLKTKQDLFEVLNKNQIVFQGKNSRFFQEINNQNVIFKLKFDISMQRKEIKTNAQNFIRTIVFNRPQSQFDFFGIQDEIQYCQNVLIDKNSYFGYIASKIYYFLKILHQIQIKKFQIVFSSNQNVFKKQLYIVDFQPYNLLELQKKATSFLNFLHNNKENSILQKKIDKAQIKNKFDKILLQYADEYSKIQHAKQTFKINQINDKCNKVYSNIYQPLYRKLSLKQLNLNGIKAKLDHDLNRYFVKINQQKVEQNKTVRKFVKKNNLLKKSQSLNSKNFLFK